MWAMQVQRLGSADEITKRLVARPRLADEEVLVRFIAGAVNHVDTFIRAGTYRTPLPFPFTVGRDVVGEVAQTRSRHFRPGQLVWSNSMGHAGRQGALSEYVAVPSDRLYHLPMGVDPVEAAAVLHGGATAAIGLFQVASAGPDQTLFGGCWRRGGLRGPANWG